MEPLAQHLARGQFGEVFGDVDATAAEVEVLDGLLLLPGAQDDRDRGFRLALVPVEPAQVEVDLSGVGGFEAPDLQLDDHQAAQTAMIEEQVDVVVVAIDHDPLLALDKGEAAAQREQELLDLAEERRLQVLLAVRVAEAEEVQQVRILEDEFGRELPRLPQRRQLLPDELVGLVGERGALEEHAVDLLPKTPDTPALHAAHLDVEIALEGVP